MDLHAAAAWVTEAHPEWDVVTMVQTYTGRYTVVIHRKEIRQ